MTENEVRELQARLAENVHAKRFETWSGPRKRQR
jgi:hypothetical protein